MAGGGEDEVGGALAVGGDGCGGRRRSGRSGELSVVQRARILSAIVEAVGEEGYARFTVEHVVSRAGVSRRTFYQEFEDREDCFLAAFVDGLERVSEMVVGAFEQEVGRGGWRGGLRGGLTGLLWFLEDEPALGRLCVVDALSGPPGVLALRARVLDGLQRVIDGGRVQSRARQALPLTAEGVVGAVLSVIHARLLAGETQGLTALVNPLMSMIVLQYLGPAAAARELTLALPDVPRAPSRALGNPYEGLNMRLTYRTLRVLEVIGEHPGASNREVANSAGISDQGQTSRLLLRLRDLGLIRNSKAADRGAPNAWLLTARGEQLQRPQPASIAIH